ncbi:DUF6471 domain-containing protein [Roseateles cavernae]|uniref:DUF6471 domain-containing protein n=1 Tax=Roseateles cavernae TaxID=3153578 RepID=UPI0032E43A1F
MWETEATNLLRAVLDDAGLTVEELQERLEAIHADHMDLKSMQKKIRRGTFPASFLLRVLFVAKREAMHSPDDRVVRLARSLDVGPYLSRFEFALERASKSVKR